MLEEKELGEEAMYKKMGKPLHQEAFVNFVAKMPEAFKREECSFSEERHHTRLGTPRCETEPYHRRRPQPRI